MVSWVTLPEVGSDIANGMVSWVMLLEMSAGEVVVSWVTWLVVVSVAPEVVVS
jgi:hypothetical protein